MSGQSPSPEPPPSPLPPLIYIIAGEPSGDALGGALMAALRQRTGGRVRFAGIGGERMAAEGLTSRVPLHELAIMGVAEVLPRARQIFRRVRETVEHIDEVRPAAVVTIDSSGFTWRIAQRLRRRGSTVPLIHYVAPMVWAWRAGRARRMARWYDHLMTLLPFEPPYFERVGLSCHFVGHPVVESGADKGDGAAFRQRHGIAPDVPVLCVLPGSRRGEVAHLLPIFKEAVVRIAQAIPDLVVVVPTVDTVAEAVSAGFADAPVRTVVVRGVEEKYDAFAASRAALAASGTVALELAMASLPMVVTYRASALTTWIVGKLVKVRFANLINLVLDRGVVPEMLRDDCAPDRLAAEVVPLMTDSERRALQKEAFREALTRLHPGGASPSLRAADDVLAVIEARSAAVRSA